MCFSARCCKAAADLFPGYDIPERGHVFRTPVLVVEVVRVFPDVESDDRDPFDPLHRDNRQGITMPGASAVGGTARYYFNFALYPLVCSGGPDEVWDIVRFDYDPATPTSLIPFAYYRNQTNPYGTWSGTSIPIVNDPYSILPNCGRRLGEPFLDSSGYADNITNHTTGG